MIYNKLQKPNTANNLFTNSLTKEMSEVKKFISKFLSSQSQGNDWMHKYSLYICNKKSTKIRSFLNLAVMDIESNTSNNPLLANNRSQHIKMAAAIEMSHCHYILHNDVIENCNIRRGDICLHRILGNRAVVFLGNFLLNQASSIIINLQNNQIQNMFSDAINKIIRGEILQNKHITYTANISENQKYKEILEGKAISFFELSSLSALLISDKNNSVNNDIINTYKEFSYNFGIAFQIMKDIQQYSDKNKPGNDFIESKLTLPIIKAMHTMPPDKKKLFWSLFSRNNIKKELQWIPIYSLLQQYDIINKCIIDLNAHLDIAMKNAQKLTDVFKRPVTKVERLIELCAYVKKEVR